MSENIRYDERKQHFSSVNKVLRGGSGSGKRSVFSL